jgi:hypothetical protein
MSNETEYPEDLNDNIIGQHLKCSKGEWTLDDAKIETGPNGFRVTILPPTAMHGRVKWVDHRPVEKMLNKYDDGFPPWDKLPDGWSAYTCFQGLAPNGELLTFTSAYGARKTLKNVITQYQFRRRRQFPICTLGTKPRGDVNGNVDPVFRIVEWVNAADFSEFFPGLAGSPAISPRTAAVLPAPMAQAPRPMTPEPDPFAGADLDDVIPF